jgi:chromosomal replication initiator protein
MVMTELDPKLTFDTFVVGPANRLASAAARRSAESPGTSYNPLFIYSSSGLGKSHILSAVAHQARKANARLRVHYQTLEGYLQELTHALASGNRDAMRDRYRDLDILLLDDVQFLAGQNEAQEMLLATLDALTASGSQIVLASDRPPADIDGLDARLVSRFSGGLIVDIAAPEYETRVAIIRRKDRPDARFGWCLAGAGPDVFR